MTRGPQSKGFTKGCWSSGVGGKGFALGFGVDYTKFTTGGGVGSVSPHINHFPPVHTMGMTGPKKLQTSPPRSMVIISHIPHMPGFWGLGFRSILDLDQVTKYFGFSSLQKIVVGQEWRDE